MGRLTAKPDRMSLLLGAVQKIMEARELLSQIPDDDIPQEDTAAYLSVRQRVDVAFDDATALASGELDKLPQVTAGPRSRRAT